MYCTKYQRICQISCAVNYRQCETAFAMPVNENPTFTLSEGRIKQLEQEIANLRAENTNLRNRLNTNPSY